MRKTIISILILSVLLSGCSSTSEIMNYRSEDYISLYDYSNLTVEHSYAQISDEDVTRIIEVEMSANEAYVEISSRKTVKSDDILLISVFDSEQYYYLQSDGNVGSLDNTLKAMTVGDTRRAEVADGVFTDVTLLGLFRTTTIEDMEFILDYYGYSTFSDLENFIRSRASDEIVFNYAFDTIWDNSVVLDIPSELEQLYIRDLNNFQEQIAQQGISFEDFLSENNMTKKDFESSFVSGYYELMMYKAILEREKLSLTSEDIKEYKTSIDDNSTLDDYDVYKQLAEQLVRNVLLETVKIV